MSGGRTLQVAETTVANQRDPSPLRQGPQGVSGRDDVVVVDSRRPVGSEGAKLPGVDGRPEHHLGDAGPQIREQPVERGSRPAAAGSDQVVGRADVLLIGQPAKRKPYGMLR